MVYIDGSDINRLFSTGIYGSKMNHRESISMDGLAILRCAEFLQEYGEQKKQAELSPRIR